MIISQLNYVSVANPNLFTGSASVSAGVDFQFAPSIKFASQIGLISTIFVFWLFDQNSKDSSLVVLYIELHFEIINLLCFVNLCCSGAVEQCVVNIVSEMKRHGSHFYQIGLELLVAVPWELTSERP